MTRFQPADTVVPQTVLPMNSSTRAFSRVFRCATCRYYNSCHRCSGTQLQPAGINMIIMIMRRILCSSWYRVIGKGILPPQQRQLDLLAKMLTFLCERLISECRIFQMNGWPMLEHTYQELLAWHGTHLRTFDFHFA